MLFAEHYDHPRKNHYMSHYDRFYLSTRLHHIDDAMDQLKKVEKLQKVQKQKANIKLVWVNKSLKKENNT